MRSSTKLVAVAVAAIAVAGASPFFVDSLRMPNGTVEAISAAGSSFASTVSAVWTQVVAASADSGGGAAASTDGTVTASTPSGVTIQVAQVAPRPNTVPAAPAAPTKPSAPAGGASSLSQGDLALVMTLLRNTLVAVHQANLTGNYTVLRDLGAPGFRDTNTATRLADLFAPIRNRGIDLSTAVLLEPRLTVAKVNDQGMLNIAGALPTQPVPVNFDLLYQGVANTWQLSAITITADTTQVTAAATPPAATAAPPAAGPPPIGSPPQATIGAAPKPPEPPAKPVIPPLPTTRP